MLELNVNSRSPAAVTAAIKKIKEMVTSGAIDKNTPVHLTIEPGTYIEMVRYNLSNPIVIESTPGTKPEECVIQAENCESFNKGVENRAIFAIGPNATTVLLRNFSIINTHNKSVTEGSTLADSAEALLWNNINGTLTAENLIIDSRQNTLCVKGYTWFNKCTISGDVDFIYGDCDTALFEDCTIHVKEDNRGDFDAFAVKSTAFANKPGFIFKGCNFTADKRKKSEIYLYRTEGHGGPKMLKWWDSCAILYCTVSDIFNPEFMWDDDMSLNIYPRGNAKTGLREYGTKIMDKDGNLTEADTARRNIKSYLMTENDFINNYASRYLILKNTPFKLE